jgi:hypothetical protein
MSDDPINALVSTLVAKAGHLSDLDAMVIALDGGLSLLHNASARSLTVGAMKLRPGYTLVRLHDLPVGVVNPWRWTLTIDDDRLRYALLHAIERLRDGTPLSLV